MAIFGLLLKSIFLVTLMIAIFIIGVIIYLYLRVKRVARSFGMGGAQTGAQTTSGRASGASGRASGQGNSSRQAGPTDRGTFVNEELYDERSPREANRKIIPKDEGEYVDYEEVK